VTPIPVLRTPRPLVPGTRMAIRRTDPGTLGVGDRVVVLLDMPEMVARVGTLSRVDARHSVSGGHAMLDVAGQSLVEVSDLTGEEAEVTPVDSDDHADFDLEPTLSALRRYMAVRSEAGEGGDVHLELSLDPITASHEVASHLHVSGPEVQHVLEAGTAPQRLTTATRILERETRLLEAILGGGS
jgi:hypothetical protein